MKILRRTLVCLAIGTFVAVNIGASRAHAGEAESLVTAIEAYSDAQSATDRDARNRAFTRAAVLFEGAATDGHATADLWVNAGNAWLQSQSIGRAVLAYRRALELNPRHARADQNIAHARSLLPSWVPRKGSSGVLDTFFFWHRTLSRNDRQAIAALAFLLTCLAVAGAVGWRRSALRGIAIVPLIVWIGAMGSLLVESDTARRSEAVIVVDETIARASDSINAAARFNAALPGGTELVVLEERVYFTHVRLANERDGWIPRSSYELVTK